MGLGPAEQRGAVQREDADRVAGRPTTVQTKPSVPKLAKATGAKAKGKKSKSTPATQNVLGVAMVAKLGWTWLLDAKTGKPLEKIDQVAVPQSTAPNVNTWPVQPIPQTPNVIDDLKMPNGQARGGCVRARSVWTQYGAGRQAVQGRVHLRPVSTRRSSSSRHSRRWTGPRARTTP